MSSVENFTDSFTMRAGNLLIAALMGNDEHATSASADIAHFVGDGYERHGLGPNQSLNESHPFETNGEDDFKLVALKD